MVNPKTVEETTLQGQVMYGISALKFKEPDLAILDKYTISKEAVNLLKEYMDIELMDDGLIAAWGNEIEGTSKIEIIDFKILNLCRLLVQALLQ